MMADLERVLKRLPEDVVEYSVFPLIPSDLPSENVIDFLEKFTDIVLAHLSDRILDYIWQHESFNLKPTVSTNDSVPPYLHGSTSFGDNIEDEWLIVHLLFEITREYPGTVVRVSDNDEEFLLIEAADELPKWLNPESAENRVYIYNGDLHVIPIPPTAESSKYPLFTPTVAEAVACVRDCACETRCSQAVQNVLSKRISCFPMKTAQNIHHVNCYLPTPLAVLLENQPALVSAGVRSFYYRDPLELKACRPMKRFKPCDLVRTRVKMTRCLYAQLVQQQFMPDRSSGWPVVAPSNPEFSERDMGMKLAHGFEILCSRYRDIDNASSLETVLEDSSPRWQQFKKSLTRKGYFRGEIEGSVLHKKLLQEAKQFYQLQIHAGENSIESTGQLVLRHLKHLEPKFEAFREAERQLPPSDDDSWINITPQQLDEMMKASGGLSVTDGLESVNLFKVAESMTAFVEHESGIDGAEFPKESVDKPNSVVKPSVPLPPPPVTVEKRDKKLVALMEAMDRELAATDIGKSFEREPKQAKPKRSSRPPPPRSTKPSDEDDFQPVNVDLTVVKNTLESYKAQQGLPGPASNILAGFGIKLPQDQVSGRT